MYTLTALPLPTPACPTCKIEDVPCPHLTSLLSFCINIIAPSFIWAPYFQNKCFISLCQILLWILLCCDALKKLICQLLRLLDAEIMVPYHLMLLVCFQSKMNYVSCKQVCGTERHTHTHTKGGGRCRNLIYVAPCATHGSKSPQKIGSKLSKVRGKICFGFAELKDRLWAKNPSRNHWISTETREIYECLSKPTRGAESRDLL